MPNRIKERILLNVSYRLNPQPDKTIKGDLMKILDKVEMIVRLKEKIEEAKKENAKTAERLQRLLDSVMNSKELKAV